VRLASHTSQDRMNINLLTVIAAFVWRYDKSTIRKQPILLKNLRMTWIRSWVQWYWRKMKFVTSLTKESQKN